MRQIKQFKPFIIKSDGIMFNDIDNTYSVYTLFENDTFFNQYPTLNIPKIFIKKVKFINKYRIINEKIIIQPDEFSKYRKDLFLQTIPDMHKPVKDNYFMDLTPIVNISEKVVNKNYKNPRIKTVFKNSISDILQDDINDKKILIYHVDVNKPFDASLFNRRLYILYSLISDYLKDKKEGDRFCFDRVFVCIASEKLNSISYIEIMDDVKQDKNRILSFFKKIVPFEIDEKLKLDYISQKVVDTFKNSDDNIREDNGLKIITKDNEEKYKKVVRDFVQKNKEIAIQTFNNIDKISQKDLIKDSLKIINTSIDQQTKQTDSLQKIEKDNNSQTKEKLKQKLVQSENVMNMILSNVEVDKNLINVTPSAKMIDIKNNIVKENDASNIISFIIAQHMNMEKNLPKIFNDLDKGMFKLKLINHKTIGNETTETDIYPSTIETHEFTLEEQDTKKKIKFNLDFPKITDDGYYYLSGNKRRLITQLIQFPVFFYKKHYVRIQTSYATITINARVQTNNRYLMTYISGFRIPLILASILHMGLENFLHFYNIQMREITQAEFNKKNNREQSGIYHFNVKDKHFEFKYKSGDEGTYQLLNGLSRIPVNNDNVMFNDIYQTKEWDIIVNFMLQNEQASNKIRQVFTYILDDLTKEVLITKDFPTEIMQVVKYCIPKIIEGFMVRKNDLNWYRVRNYEVLLSLARHEILKSYSNYLNQRRAGLEGEFNMKKDIVLKQIKTSMLQQNFEEINPVEFYTYLDRVTFKGEGSGMSKESISGDVALRSLSDTYFGSIDPVDVPEGGESIGVINHLTPSVKIMNDKGSISINNIDRNTDKSVMSMTLNLVPFVTNNEPTRMIMANQHFKQTLSLMESEQPLTQTGYEKLMTNYLSKSFQIYSNGNGTIKNITKDKIYVEYDDGEKESFDITPKRLKSGLSVNQVSRLKPILNVGDRFKQSEIIAEGQNVIDKTISNGRNLKCAYMLWKGYNYEDGIVISESAQKKYTIERYNEKLVFLEPGSSLTFLHDDFSKQIDPNIKLISYKPQKIFEIGILEDDESLKNGQIEISSRKPGNLLKIEIYGKIDDFPELEPYKKYYNKKVKYNKGELIDGVIIKYDYSEFQPISVGDKLANRHGNKGVVAYIEKDENMPIGNNNKPVEIILNPIGVVNRTNVGQIMEIYSNNIQKKMTKLILNNKHNKQYITGLIKKVYKEWDNTTDKRLYMSISTNIEKMKKQEFEKYIDEIEKHGFIMYSPPFNTPNPKQVLKVLDILNLKPSYNLYLPEYNEYTKRPITVGYEYIVRLEHIQEEKVGQASEGRVNIKTGQTENMKDSKSQRVGEFDSFALLGHNQNHVLQELFTSRQDDQKQRNKMVNEIIMTGQTNLKFSEDALQSVKYRNVFYIQMGIDPSSIYDVNKFEK